MRSGEEQWVLAAVLHQAGFEVTPYTVFAAEEEEDDLSVRDPGRRKASVSGERCTPCIDVGDSGSSWDMLVDHHYGALADCACDPGYLCVKKMCGGRHGNLEARIRIKEYKRMRELPYFPGNAGEVIFPFAMGERASVYIDLERSFRKIVAYPKAVPGSCIPEMGEEGCKVGIQVSSPRLGVLRPLAMP